MTLRITNEPHLHRVLREVAEVDERAPELDLLGLL